MTSSFLLLVCVRNASLNTKQITGVKETFPKIGKPSRWFEDQKMNCCMYLQEAFKYQISLAYECFPLCYLNSSSFVVNVSPVCCFIFFLLIWDNRKIA